MTSKEIRYNIFLAPRSNERSHENFKSTIRDGIDYDKISNHLSDTGKQVVGKMKKIYAWGNLATKKASWDKMQHRDYVLFYIKGRFKYAGRLAYKEFNESLGRALWPLGPTGKPWSCVFFLEDIKEIDIDSSKVKKLAGYEPGWVVQGFQPLHEKGINNIYKKYGTVENFLSGAKSIEINQNLPSSSEDTKIKLLLKKKQIILYGPPGTGKTYNTKIFSVNILRHKNG